MDRFNPVSLEYFQIIHKHFSKSNFADNFQLLLPLFLSGISTPQGISEMYGPVDKAPLETLQEVGGGKEPIL